jgi:hypothetical protein
MTASGFRFQLSVPEEVTYVIEASTNLHDWTPIATNTAHSSTVNVTDIEAEKYPIRFYRAKIP